MASETYEGIWKIGATNILKPINVKIIANPYFNFENKFKEFDSKKYIDLKPKIAKIFEEYKINGSLGVIEKIAGIESTAKIKSVVSTNNRTRNNLVATNFPSIREKNFAPSNLGEILKKRIKTRASKLFS